MAEEHEYALRGSETMDRAMQARRSKIEAAFLLPYLTPGMSLVDIGCGQGTITTGLADAIAPGQAVGFDLQADHIERARAFAAEHGVANVRFEVGDAYEPTLEHAYFDVAYANAVYSHLGDPVRGLRAAYNLLRPGGLIGIRDLGGRHVVTGHDSDAVLRAIEIMHATFSATSGNPYTSRCGDIMNRLCREAGFEVVAVTATWDVRLALTLPEQMKRGPLVGPLGERAIQLGITTRPELDQILERATSGWGEDPDALIAVPWFEVVARRP